MHSLSKFEQKNKAFPNIEPIAIISRVPGLEAVVLIEEQQAQEFVDHNTDHHDDERTSCYIEACSGAKFAVEIRHEFGFGADGILAELEIDGNFVKTERWYPTAPKSKVTIDFVRKLHGETCSYHGFTFKDISSRKRIGNPLNFIRGTNNDDESRRIGLHVQPK